MRPWRPVRAVFTALRIALAAAILAACLSELPAWQARRELAALPDYDFAANAQTLMAEGRLTEAALVAKAGVETAPAAERPRLRALLERIETRRTSVPYRLTRAAEGALWGEAHDVWGLGGALAADLFVFGDVRDLLMQGAHAAQGEPVDELLIGLSAVGLLTTLAPGADVGVGLLKAARRVGALSADMARRIRRLAVRAVRRGDTAGLSRVARDMERLADATDPATAMIVLRAVDDPAALARVARFVKRRPAGAFALWLGGGGAVKWLRRAGPDAGAALMAASAKGRAGLRWLAGGGGRLLSFHPLLGLLKGVYKGNAGDFLVRMMAERLPLLLGLSLIWLALEALRVLRALWKPGIPGPVKLAR